MTLGQNLQGQINSSFKNVRNFRRKVLYIASSFFFDLEQKLLEIEAILKKQRTGLEIPYRQDGLRFDLRSTVQATEVTECQ